MYHVQDIQLERENIICGLFLTQYFLGINGELTCLLSLGGETYAQRLAGERDQQEDCWNMPVCTKDVAAWPRL